MNPVLFNHFKIANEGWYFAKQAFYILKDRILKTEGTYTGLDVQFIKRKCNRCAGTGNFLYWKKDNYGCQEYDRCEKCGGSGTFDTKKHYLKRYVLNDEVFHLPTHIEPQFGDRINGVIRGKIKHDPHTPEECYTAILTLFLYYDIATYNQLLAENPQARHYWQLHAKEIREELNKIREVQHAA